MHIWFATLWTTFALLILLNTHSVGQVVNFLNALLLIDDAVEKTQLLLFFLLCWSKLIMTWQINKIYMLRQKSTHIYFCGHNFLGIVYVTHIGLFENRICSICIKRDVFAHGTWGNFSTTHLLNTREMNPNSIWIGLSRKWSI